MAFVRGIFAVGLSCNWVVVSKFEEGRWRF